MLDMLQELLEQGQWAPKDSRKSHTTTKEKQKEKDLGMDELLRRSSQRTNNITPAPQKEEPQPEQKTKPHLKTVGRATTLHKVSRIVPSEEMKQKLASIDPSLRDEISDEQALKLAGYEKTRSRYRDVRPQPVKPSMLPKVINRALVTKGVVEPEWHMVKHLPGYLAQPIRAIGRGVFKALTRTPLEQIQVIANLMGQGPNEDREVNAVTAFLVKNGLRERDAEIVFHKYIPDYGAEIKLFKALGITFLLVKDFAGHYIYAWPSDEELPQLEAK